MLACLLAGFKVHHWEELQVGIWLHMPRGCFVADPGVCRAALLHCMWQAAVGDICQSYSFEQVMRHVETREKTSFPLVKVSAGGN